MISVIYKKSDYLKTLKYVLGKKDAELVDSNMAGTQPLELSKQFLTIARLNERVSRRCAHLVISINKSESLSNSQYRQVTQEFLKDLGYLSVDERSQNTSQFIAIRHRDRTHEHIHIVTSRIQYNGTSVSDSYDFFKAEVSTSRISAQMGLAILPVSNNAIAYKLETEWGITAETSPERQKSIKLVNTPHKNPTAKEIVRKAIREAIIDSPSLSTYVKRLRASDIGVLPKVQGEDLLGLTYVSGDVKITGYQVYKDYSWPKLQLKYGLTYEPERDRHIFEKTKVEAISEAANLNSKQAVQLSIQPSSLDLTIEEIASNSAEAELLSPQYPNSRAEVSNKPVNTAVEPQLTQNNNQELGTIILTYMQFVNKSFIQGKELSAKWEKNLLQVFRQNSTIAMQSSNTIGQWKEEINTLTTDEIQQISQLKALALQKIEDKANDKPDISKTTYENEI